MNQPLFDLDQALDDFEHAELDKIMSVPTQPAFPGEPFIREELPSNEETSQSASSQQDILCLLSTSSSEPKSSSDFVRTVSTKESFPNSEVLDEDAKDSCSEHLGMNYNHTSGERNINLVIEDQSSSNMDSGLCSSSEFIPIEHDLTGPMSSEMNNDAASSAPHNLESAFFPTETFPPSEVIGQQNYAADVAMLFAPANESTGDLSSATPTMQSPENLNLLTPVGNPSFTSNESHKDETDIVSVTVQNTDTSKVLHSDISEANGNDSFFFPKTSETTPKPFNSLPVVSPDDKSAAATSNSTQGSCRRPCSLFLPDTSKKAQQPNRPAALQKSAGTKRPSSLFGLPCVSSAPFGSSSTVTDTSSPKNDKKPMLQPSSEEVSFSLMSSAPEGQSLTSPLILDANSNQLDSVTSDRRSPSNLSANSEILQLPVPIIPPSSSPDSGSLSRSSLCDGVPSPMTQAALPVSEMNPPESSVISENVESGEHSPNILPDDDSSAEANALASLEASLATDSSRILPCGETLGRQAPAWVPDSDAPNCAGCATKFTFTKRRHHCRACGKVYCNSCCSLRYHIEFLNTVARVCIACYPELVRLEARRNNSDIGPPVAAPSALRTVKGDSNTEANVSSPTRAQREGRKNKKTVVFSDGVRPGELPSAAVSGSDPPSTDISPAGENDGQIVASNSEGVISAPGEVVESEQSKSSEPIEVKVQFSWPSDRPIMMQCGVESLCAEDTSITVMLNPSLAIRIQRVDLSSCCCPCKLQSSDQPNTAYYAIVSLGLCACTESEYLVVLKTESLFDHLDNVVSFFDRLWYDADQGRFYDEFSCVLLDTVGFLVFRPSFQCSQHLPVPTYSRWMASVMITDQNELAWTRLFPLRLLLRLGHESGHYPTSIVSDMTRSALFHQPGHTVLSLFSDFRSFRYRLESIAGAVLHLDGACSDQTIVATSESSPPRNRKHVLLLPVTAASQVRQLALAGNEHVLAIGTSFSPSADGHLVAVQAKAPDAAYRTEAITMLGVPQATDQIRVLAGSFIIFNGSLRPDPSGTTKARLTVLEDGAMIQLTADQMSGLRTALAGSTNFSTTCVTANTTEGDAESTDSLEIEWIQSSLELPAQWTRPQIALRCRLPIGFHMTMVAQISQVVKSAAYFRVATVYSWPFNSSSQVLWCSPTIFSSAAMAENASSSSSQPTDPLLAQATVTAFVLDRASLALASSTQLALSPFADTIVRSVSLSEKPVCDSPAQVVVRTRLEPDSLGFEAAVLSSSNNLTESLSLPNEAIQALDAELVPTLFNLAQSLGSKIPVGGLCFELVLFSVPPIVVSSTQHVSMGPSATTVAAEAEATTTTTLMIGDDALPADMMVDDL